MNIESFNKSLSQACHQLTILENAFPKIIQDKINKYGEKAFHQACEFLYHKILEVVATNQEIYLEYNASQNEQSGEVEAPYWDARVVIDLNKIVKLQLIPKDGFFDKGSYKIVKKAVTVQFKFTGVSLTELKSNWTVLILAKQTEGKAKSTEEHLTDDFFIDDALFNHLNCQRGVKKLKKLLDLNCPNLIELPMVYPTNPFQASQAWYNTSLLRAMEDRSFFIDRFEALETTISSQEILNVMLDIGEAIKHLHLHGYVHCDVKPANMLAAFEEGQLKGKLADLDLVTSIGDKFEGDPYPFRATSHILHGLATPFSDVYGFMVSMAPLILGKGLIRYFEQIVINGSSITKKNLEDYLDQNFRNIMGFSLINVHDQPISQRWNLTTVQENYITKFKQILEFDEDLSKSLCPENETLWYNLTENDRLDHLREWNTFSATHKIPTMQEIMQFLNEKIKPHL